MLHFLLIYLHIHCTHQANSIFQDTNLTLEEQVSRSAEVAVDLVEITNVSVNTSLLPAALEVANTVLRDVITVLNDHQEPVDTEFQQVEYSWSHTTKTHDIAPSPFRTLSISSATVFKMDSCWDGWHFKLSVKSTTVHLKCCVHV